MSILQTIQNQLQNYAVDQISQYLKVDKTVIEKATKTIAPVLLSGMSKNAKDQNLATGLFDAITKEHDGSIFVQVTDLINDPSHKSGAKILKHVLGQNTEIAENAVSRATGLSQSQTKNLFEVVAPLVMGTLGQEQSDKELDTIGIQDVFNQFEKEKSQNPNLKQALEPMDLDGDGDIDADDWALKMKSIQY